MCPNSSTTSWAVSWSMGWLMVAITPIFIMVLMTSFALTAMRLASSPTVIVSGSCTSRLTGAVGWANSPPRASDADVHLAPRTGSRSCFFLKRAPAPAADVQFLATVLGGALALVDGLRRARLGRRRGGRLRRLRRTALGLDALALGVLALPRLGLAPRFLVGTRLRLVVHRRRASASSRSRSRRSASRCSVSRRSASRRWASSAWRTRSTSSWRCRCSSSSTVRLR